MTPAEIEPATFRFVAQHFNHCATVVIFAVGTNKYQGLVVWWLEHWIIIHRIRIKRNHILFGNYRRSKPWRLTASATYLEHNLSSSIHSLVWHYVTRYVVGYCESTLPWQRNVTTSQWRWRRPMSVFGLMEREVEEGHERSICNPAYSSHCSV